jgi:hypothetical protein
MACSDRIIVKHASGKHSDKPRTLLAGKDASGMGLAKANRSPTQPEAALEEWFKAALEEKVKATVAEIGLLEDKVDFGAILALVVPLLVEARRLAKWTQDAQLDDTGADMLLRIGEQWLAIEAILDANCIGAGKARWCTDNDRVGDAASCLHDLACGVRKNAAWLRYLPEITNTCLLSLAPDACMGMPHSVFAKRLSVAIELIHKIVAPVDQASDNRTNKGGAENSARVVLGGRADGPIVLGKTKRKLTMAQYNVVKALLDAGESGLTKDELVSHSRHTDARMILTRLADKDEDWKQVIHLAGQTGGGYRIK